MDNVSRFKRDCFTQYLADIRREVPLFPRRYVFPDGNPIRPVLPIQAEPRDVMVIGAFPSARFESRDGKLIPVGDNLSPFGPEEYFDGRQVRIQESAKGLREKYLDPLGLDPQDLWITDIVKVYLYPEKHLANCRSLFPRKTFVNTHRQFPALAWASRGWFLRELETCNPRIVITLGEVCARVVGLDKRSQSMELLDGRVKELEFERSVRVVHLAHPEIRRRDPKWDRRTKTQIARLGPQLRRLV